MLNKAAMISDTCIQLRKWSYVLIFKQIIHLILTAKTENTTPILHQKPGSPGPVPDLVVHIRNRGASVLP